MSKIPSKKKVLIPVFQLDNLKTPLFKDETKFENVMGLNLQKKSKTLRYFILKSNIHSDYVILLAGFIELEGADKHFVNGSSFVSIASWVEEIGHYCCNSHEFETSGNLDVIIDIRFVIQSFAENSYEMSEYKKYRGMLIELLDQSILKNQYY